MEPELEALAAVSREEEREGERRREGRGGEGCTSTSSARSAQNTPLQRHAVLDILVKSFEMEPELEALAAVRREEEREGERRREGRGGEGCTSTSSAKSAQNTPFSDTPCSISS